MTINELKNEKPKPIHAKKLWKSLDALYQRPYMIRSNGSGWMFGS